MSEKELKPKRKESNEDVMKRFIKKHMGRSYKEIDIHEIATRAPHEKIDRDERIAIAKLMQKDFEKKKELDDLHFKATMTAGLVGEEP